MIFDVFGFFFFPTCQVRVVRFYVSSFPSSPLLLVPGSCEHLRSVFAIGCRTSTAIICVRCTLPDLNQQKECHKRWQKECQKISEDLPERMPDRMSGDVPERMPGDMSEEMPERMSDILPEYMSETICQKDCQKECQKLW